MLSRLRAAPITVPMMVAVALFLAWVPQDGGQPVTEWVPGALLVLALVALAAVAVPGGWPTAPPLVRAATVLLGAYTAWSFLSIAWADDQGTALEGADRTLLYFAVFALFALWPQRPRTAGWVLGTWTLGLGVLAVVTLLRTAWVDDPASLFVGDRLSEPAGYPNAAAAIWLMGLWPAIALAASRRVPWALRGAFAALAVVLVDTAVLSLSRGAVLSLPICLVLFVALAGGRLRHLAVLVPIGAAVAAVATRLFAVGDALTAEQPVAIQQAVDSAARSAILLAVLAGALVAAVAAWESLRPPSEATARTVRRAWTGIVVAGGLAVVVGGLAVAGNPVTRVQDGWDSFKGGYTDSGGANRLASGLGSNRYDFYRVGLDVFADHPIAGAGADNYFQDYLQRGGSEETPKYPHDLALRTLAQTGLVGGLLLLGAFGTALAAAWRAMRQRDALAAAVAGGAVGAFAYWVVHGMTDWFWEWAGLGAPAFALLGLACSLAPRTRTTVAAPAAGATAPPGPGRRRAHLALGAVALLAALAVVAAPWLAERQVRSSAEVFRTRPFAAYDGLDRAARLDPFSDRPALVKGSIALRFGDLPRARAAFEEALARNPRGQYATLELGAIASAQGRPADARRLLARAVALAPRDATAREALAVVRGGGTVDVTVLNRRILRAGQALGGT
jgi:tetratricopeptide (TPR) repeat protein